MEENPNGLSPKEAKAELKAAKARNKALRPWYKKPLPIALIILLIIFGLNLGSGDNSSSTSTPSSQENSAMIPETQSTEIQEQSSETVSQKSAIRKADLYLSTMPFSRESLIKQLEFEGFSTDDATYGVDALSVDWNEQASKKAKQYLDIMGYSRSGLIEQLEFEGFTSEQAEFGVTANGL